MNVLRELGIDNLPRSWFCCACLSESDIGRLDCGHGVCANCHAQIKDAAVGVLTENGPATQAQRAELAAIACPICILEYANAYDEHGDLISQPSAPIEQTKPPVKVEVDAQVDLADLESIDTGIAIASILGIDMVTPAETNECAQIGDLHTTEPEDDSVQQTCGICEAGAIGLCLMSSCGCFMHARCVDSAQILGLRCKKHDERPNFRMLYDGEGITATECANGAIAVLEGWVGSDRLANFRAWQRRKLGVGASDKMVRGVCQNDRCPDCTALWNLVNLGALKLSVPTCHPENIAMKPKNGRAMRSHAARLLHAKWIDIIDVPSRAITFYGMCTDAKCTFGAKVLTREGASYARTHFPDNVELYESFCSAHIKSGLSYFIPPTVAARSAYLRARVSDDLDAYKLTARHNNSSSPATRLIGIFSDAFAAADARPAGSFK